jgi:hypothetical protein
MVFVNPRDIGVGFQNGDMADLVTHWTPRA